ncbi:hypothetical protein [Chromobacterium sphagni]|uniref:Lipoprotein SmpA/OmlA domain-containing protein n=1 Tax=Chromobacterium sphagni TaxID=1903179 RepID=A0A1S1WZZ0_9NEIS|nr:hypothetical protein [Chromobacterium sphagni]OHX12506.1 hypothetical protein BI347_02555 [Chromobacterium sphagni]OHX21409.1 hypothetical protein BI344_02445 [Chromobacterium sphagni]
MTTIFRRAATTRRRCALACAMLLGLSACATVGNGKLQDTDGAKITALLSREPAGRQPLQALLGKPDDSIPFGNGRELWVYRSDKYTPKAQNFTDLGIWLRAQNHQIKELVVLFDRNGRVLQWRLSEDSRDENTGLINQPLTLPAPSAADGG